MDNASKALVMAGAILIAVMLISLGVLLFNRASDIADETSNQLDSLAIQTYNAGYTNYAGEKVKGSSVKQLINKIQSHNANDEETDQYGEITLSGSVTDVNTVKSSKWYNVKITAYGNNGAISAITINNASSGD